MTRLRYFSFVLFCSLFLRNATAEARAGGGGSGGRSKGGYVSAAIGALVWAIYTVRRRKMLEKAAADLEVARTRDRSWDQDKFKAIAKTTFRAYQDAWSKKNLESVRHLLHVDYFTEAQATMRAALRGKVNILKDPLICEMNLMSIRDVEGKSGDVFVMEIQASMIDYTVDESDGRFIESTLPRKDYELKSSYAKRATLERSDFTEFWVFMRVGDKWRLLNIKQTSSIVADLKNMGETELLAVLRREEQSKQVRDDVFYETPDRARKKA